LHEIIKEPCVQPDLTNPWERFGFILYNLGRDIEDKTIMAELQRIIAAPGDKHLDLLLRILHLK
jgi:hypothetical protein